MTPQVIHILIPGTCEDGSFQRERHFEDAIKLSILIWRNYLDGPRVTTRVLKWERETETIVTIVCVYVTWRAGSLLRGRQSGREHCSWMEGSRNHHWLQAFTSELEVLSHLLIIISDLK